MWSQTRQCSFKDVAMFVQDSGYVQLGRGHVRQTRPSAPKHGHLRQKERLCTPRTRACAPTTRLCAPRTRLCAPERSHVRQTAAMCAKDAAMCVQKRSCVRQNIAMCVQKRGHVRFWTRPCALRTRPYAPKTRPCAPSTRQCTPRRGRLGQTHGQMREKAASCGNGYFHPPLKSF